MIWIDVSRDDWLRLIVRLLCKFVIHTDAITSSLDVVLSITNVLIGRRLKLDMQIAIIVGWLAIDEIALQIGLLRRNAIVRRLVRAVVSPVLTFSNYISLHRGVWLSLSFQAVVSSITGLDRCSILGWDSARLLLLRLFSTFGLRLLLHNLISGSISEFDWAIHRHIGPFFSCFIFLLSCSYASLIMLALNESRLLRCL